MPNKFPGGIMLFFKSKKDREKEAGDSAQPAARAPRYECISMVSINGYEGMAVLRNVSQTGFRMESKTFVEITVGGEYVMRLSPEAAAGMDHFDVKVEVRWAQSLPDKFAVGFLITQTGNRAFQKYVEFLKAHAQKSG
jgi:hypothetical protein